MLAYHSNFGLFLLTFESHHHSRCGRWGCMLVYHNNLLLIYKHHYSRCKKWGHMLLYQNRLGTGISYLHAMLWCDKWLMV